MHTIKQWTDHGRGGDKTKMAQLHSRNTVDR